MNQPDQPSSGPRTNAVDLRAFFNQLAGVTRGLITGQLACAIPVLGDSSDEPKERREAKADAAISTHGPDLVRALSAACERLMVLLEAAGIEFQVATEAQDGSSAPKPGSIVIAKEGDVRRAANNLRRFGGTGKDARG